MARGLQAVDLLHRVDLRIAGEAAQRHHVGRGVVLEDLAGLGDEPVDGLGGLLRRGVGALRPAAGRAPTACGSVSLTASPRSSPRKTTTKRCSRTGSTKTSTPGSLIACSCLAHGDAALGGRPAGAAVGDLAVVVDGAEVAADGHVARADLEVDAERFEDAAADAVFERIVAEQAEVAGAAAGRDAGQHRDAQAADAFAGQASRFGVRADLQLGLAARLQGQAAQAVRDQQDDFGGVLFA